MAAILSWSQCIKVNSICKQIRGITETSSHNMCTQSCSQKVTNHLTTVESHICRVVQDTYQYEELFYCLEITQVDTPRWYYSFREIQVHLSMQVKWKIKCYVCHWRRMEYFDCNKLFCCQYCYLAHKSMTLDQWMLYEIHQLLISHTFTMKWMYGFNLEEETHHDDIIKWEKFPRYWPFVRRIHRYPVNSPHKGQWRGALMFSLICIWINSWENNHETGDLRRYRTHYDVIETQIAKTLVSTLVFLVVFGAVDEPLASCMMIHLYD